jgi:hypothetical protein
MKVTTLKVQICHNCYWTDTIPVPETKKLDTMPVPETRKLDTMSVPETR